MKPPVPCPGVIENHPLCNLPEFTDRGSFQNLPRIDLSGCFSFKLKNSGKSNSFLLIFNLF
jgi:hypothetical protein